MDRFEHELNSGKVWTGKDELGLKLEMLGLKGLSVRVTVLNNKADSHFDFLSTTHFARCDN